MGKDWSKKLDNCRNCNKPLLKRQITHCSNECKLDEIRRNSSIQQNKLANCKSCGKELGRRQMMYCSNTCKLKDPDNIKSRTSKKEKQDESKLIKCVHTGKTFTDIKNYSGILTKHLDNLAIDSYNVKTNVFDNFEIIDNPDFLKPKYTCKYCDWSTIDVENKSGCITSHIKTKHNVSPTEHINKFPEDEKFWSYTHSNELKEYFIGSEKTKYVICKICNEKFKKISNTHLKLHNITEDEYKLKYNVEYLSSDEFRDNSKLHYQEVFHKYCRKNFSSKPENDIKNFLEEFNIKVNISERKIVKCVELDLYLPDYNVAIEYDGLYYHSEFSGKKLKDYHLNKTKKCAEQNIHLIHIFEDEWLYKKDIVKMRLRYILNLFKNKVYARKCSIKEIDVKLKNEFLNTYHLQGEDRSKVNLGLYDGNELVSVMTFSNLRIALGSKNNNVNEYELSRFSSKINVVGGASKLLSYFKKVYNPSKIISYADKRWSTNLNDTVYNKLGFSEVNETNPNYWYIKNGTSKRSHRFNYTKHRIVNELGGNPDLTEVENMRLMGFDRIWDCGNIKYEMIIK